MSDRGKYASIDIGSNSTLLLIARYRPGDVLEPLLQRQETTRLGNGLERTARIAPGPAARNLAVLREYRVLCDAEGVQGVAACGTAALRDAENREEVLREMGAVLGTDVQVLSGEEEARMTFRSALEGLEVPDGEVVLADVGGRSTELIRGRDREIRDTVSLPAGAVVFTEAFLKSDPPAASEIRALRERVTEVFSGAPDPAGAVRLIGVAGTITTLAAIDLGLTVYDAARVHGHVLTRERLEDLVQELTTLPLKARREIPGLHPDRADIIIAGAVIFSRLLHRYAADTILVSERGLRFGMLRDLAERHAL